MELQRRPTLRIAKQTRQAILWRLRASQASKKHSTFIARHQTLLEASKYRNHTGRFLGRLRHLQQALASCNGSIACSRVRWLDTPPLQHGRRGSWFLIDSKGQQPVGYSRPKEGRKGLGNETYSWWTAVATTISVLRCTIVDRWLLDLSFFSSWRMYGVRHTPSLEV